MTSLFDIVADHRAGAAPLETMRRTYAAIGAYDDPALFITLRDQDDACAAAAALDPADAPRLPLFGVPFAVKDNIDVAGLPTTAGCPAFAYRPAANAYVVQRLVDAGAIPIGKTNLDQFATGLVGVRSPYGTPRNARYPGLIPGGSSSGSASVVAAGLVPFSLGTDTAGSGRVPAALQGIVGLKPSLGALSNTGVVPACRTLDCVSVFAATVSEAQTVFSAARGFDAVDAYSRRYADVERVSPAGRARVAVPSRSTRRFLGDAFAEAAFDAALAEMSDRGVQLIEIDFDPFFEAASLLYGGPWVAERYVTAKAIVEGRPEAMLAVTRSIIDGARRHDAASAFEAFYRLAILRRAIEPMWDGADALAVPTVPTIYTLAQVAADPIATNSNLGLYTNFANLVDFCGIAFPGPVRQDGAPSGITLLAPAGCDHRVAAIAMRLERSDDR